MMNIFLKVSVFLLFFQVEVKVKAHAPSVDPTESALSTVADAKDFNSPGKEFKLAPQTLVMKLKDGLFRFCEGQMRVESEHENSMAFLHGLIISFGGAYSISTKSKDNKKVWIANERSSLTIKMRGGRELFLPPGFQVWIAGLNSEGEQTFGVIEPWDFKEYVVTLNSMHFKEKTQLLDLARQLKVLSKEAQAQSPGLYQKIIDRRIASLEKEEQMRQSQLASDRRRKMQQRKYFFQRTFER